MEKLITPPTEEPHAQDKPETAVERERPGTQLGKLIGIAAYPVGAASGFVAFETQVRSTFYGNFAKRKMFADIQKPVTEALQTLVEKGAKDKHVDIAEETWKLQESYRLAVQNRIKDWGYKGLRDYWKCLHRNQQIKIASETATITGITLGALILLSENIDRARDMFQNPKDDQGPSR